MYSVSREQSFDPSQGTNPVSESQISLDDFTVLKVIGRGSYAKVLMVSISQGVYTPQGFKAGYKKCDLVHAASLVWA